MSLARILSWSFIFLALASACRRPGESPRVDFRNLQALEGEYLQVVVETPAGAAQFRSYHPESRSFEPADSIPFLPIPGNYGFIPGAVGAPGVLLLSGSLPPGEVVLSIPIAALRLETEGVVHTHLIAVPADGPRPVEATNFRDFMIRYDAARRMLEDWFIALSPMGETHLLSWENEQFARSEVDRYLRSE